MHTGREGMAAMPYFDDFDLGTVDILLISQYVYPYLPCHLSQTTGMSLVARMRRCSLVLRSDKRMIWDKASLNISHLGHSIAECNTIHFHTLLFLLESALSSAHRCQRLNWCVFDHDDSLLTIDLLVFILITQLLCPMYCQRQTFEAECS